MAAGFGERAHREHAPEADRILVPGHYLPGRVVRPDRRPESR